MYKTSTFFIKGQIVDVTMAELVEIYNRELQTQGVDKINVDFDRINFTNNTAANFLYRSTNRFSNFSYGFIQVEETDAEFIVCLEAGLTNILIAPAALSAIATLLFLLAAGFEILPFAIGLGLFCLLAVMSYISTSISSLSILRVCGTTLNNSCRAASNNCHKQILIISNSGYL